MRKKIKLSILLLVLTLTFKSPFNKKYHYSSNWYASVFQDLHEQQFKDTFRMDRYTFECLFLRIYHERSGRSRQEFKKSLLMFLGYMGHTSVLRIIRELFGVSLSSVFREDEQMSRYISQFRVIISNYPV